MERHPAALRLPDDAAAHAQVRSARARRRRHPALRRAPRRGAARLHARDVRKTTTLNDAGWTVLRVREAPLRPISLHDVLVPKISDMKPVVDATLLQIEQLCEVRLEGLSGYLAESNLKNETARDRYIKKLLKGQKLRSET